MSLSFRLKQERDQMESNPIIKAKAYYEILKKAI